MGEVGGRDSDNGRRNRERREKRTGNGMWGGQVEIEMEKQGGRKREKVERRKKLEIGRVEGVEEGKKLSDGQREEEGALRLVVQSVRLVQGRNGGYVRKIQEGAGVPSSTVPAPYGTNSFHYFRPVEQGVPWDQRDRPKRNRRRVAATYPLYISMVVSI